MAVTSDKNPQQIFDSVSLQFEDDVSNIDFVDVNKTIETSKRKALQPMAHSAVDFCLKVSESSIGEYLKQSFSFDGQIVGAKFFSK